MKWETSIKHITQKEKKISFFTASKSYCNNNRFRHCLPFEKSEKKMSSKTENRTRTIQKMGENIVCYAHFCNEPEWHE